jgi:S-adenosylmethionine/arginine decarboxylase-like enzyme
MFDHEISREVIRYGVAKAKKSKELPARNAVSKMIKTNYSWSIGYSENLQMQRLLTSSIRNLHSGAMVSGHIKRAAMNGLYSPRAGDYGENDDSCTRSAQLFPRPFTRWQPPRADFKRLFRENKVWGMLTSINAFKCDRDIITSAEKLETFVKELCDLIKMDRFGRPVIVHFGREKKVEGFSLMQLIQTSNITGHFANELRAAYIDIFSCSVYSPQEAANFTAKFFGAKDFNYHVILRGEDMPTEY